MGKLAPAVFALSIAIFSLHNANAQAISYGVARYGDRADPVVNNYLSARYDHLLQISPRFRSHRMWKECHTIDWAELRSDCLASFDQYEPVLYSSS